MQLVVSIPGYLRGHRAVARQSGRFVERKWLGISWKDRRMENHFKRREEDGDFSNIF
jgi:hypothetical protein